MSKHNEKWNVMPSEKIRKAVKEAVKVCKCEKQ